MGKVCSKDEVSKKALDAPVRNSLRRSNIPVSGDPQEIKNDGS